MSPDPSSSSLGSHRSTCPTLHPSQTATLSQTSNTRRNRKEYTRLLNPKTRLDSAAVCETAQGGRLGTEPGKSIPERYRAAPRFPPSPINTTQTSQPDTPSNRQKLRGTRVAVGERVGFIHPELYLLRENELPTYIRGQKKKHVTHRDTTTTTTTTTKRSQRCGAVRCVSSNTICARFVAGGFS